MKTIFTGRKMRERANQQRMSCGIKGGPYDTLEVYVVEDHVVEDVPPYE